MKVRVVAVSSASLLNSLVERTKSDSEGTRFARGFCPKIARIAQHTERSTTKRVCPNVPTWPLARSNTSKAKCFVFVFFRSSRLVTMQTGVLQRTIRVLCNGTGRPLFVNSSRTKKFEMPAKFRDFLLDSRFFSKSENLQRTPERKCDPLKRVVSGQVHCVPLPKAISS